MEWPDIVELTEYWKDFPPAHLAMRGMFLAESGRPSAEQSKVTETEQRVAAQSNVKPFKALPAHILRALQERKKSSG